MAGRWPRGRWSLAALFTVVFTVVVPLAACGEDAKTAQQAALEAAQDFQGAVLDRDGNAACAALTGSAKRELVEGSESGVDCAALMEQVFALMGEDEFALLEDTVSELNTSSVRVVGSSATIDMPESGELALEEVAGGWYVTSADDLVSPGLVIDDEKTEAALEQNLRDSLGKKVRSVDCPTGVEVEAGATFECTVRLRGGGTETAKLRIRNEDADVEVTDLR